MKILKFYSPFCGPCKALDKNLKDAKIEYTNIDVTSEDDNIKLLLDKYKIVSVPTLVLADEEDNLIRKFIGVKTAEDIKKFINEDTSKS